MDIEPVKRAVIETLNQRFVPSFLEVLNESDQHGVPIGSESHFKITLVTNEFITKRLVMRHQMVYAVLKTLLAGPIHALALHTYTEEEWSLRQTSPDSPDCRGGSKA